MKVRVIAFLLLFWPFCGTAQGFLDLGTNAEGFATPAPNQFLTFLLITVRIQDTGSNGGTSRRT